MQIKENIIHQKTSNDKFDAIYKYHKKLSKHLFKFFIINANLLKNRLFLFMIQLDLL